MIKKISIYIILPMIIGIVIMITPLMFLSSQQLIIKEKVFPQEDQYYKINLMRDNETNFINIEKIQVNIVNSIISIVLISMLTLIPAFIISNYIKKKVF
ncbi:MAG: hypothetical protein QXY96_02015 [Candidatus Methanomethylicaceae archaeon]